MLKSKNIESEIYGENGLFFRTVVEIKKNKLLAIEKSGKSRQQLDLFIRRFKSSKIEDRPKFSTIKEIADSLGIE